MGSESKVIKPPIESMMSGRKFRPSIRFRNKMWLQGIIIVVVIWLTTIVGIVGAVGAIASPLERQAFMDIFWIPLNLWYWGIALAILIPGMIYYHIYINSIEYSVLGETGEASPEIYVQKGILNKTRKHVPFRTITNISSRAGIFDRWFGIGSVEIETAGHSGQTMSGPEEKLEGITFYEELRDFVLMELRKFTTPYVTGTEVVFPVDETVPRMEGTLEDEILLVLREIRDLLRNQRN